jgi:hypothetical protein
LKDFRGDTFRPYMCCVMQCDRCYCTRLTRNRRRAMPRGDVELKEQRLRDAEEIAIGREP